VRRRRQVHLAYRGRPNRRLRVLGHQEYNAFLAGWARAAGTIQSFITKNPEWVLLGGGDQ